MPSRSMLRNAQRWRPNSSDQYGSDKLALLRFLIRHAAGHEHAIPIKSVLQRTRFRRSYKKESFQLKLLVPLRSDPRVFVGTSNRGIYLVTTAEDADNTIGFYTSRIRSEQKHLSNLKALAKHYQLFAQYQSREHGKSDALIYFDESGTPSLGDISTSPFFIITGIVVESAREVERIGRRLRFIAARLGKPADYEFKSTKLKKTQYEVVLRELGPAEFQWGSVCFLKARL